MTLSAEHLTYEYAKGTSLAHRALDDVSLDVGPGGSLLIIGSTGSGKSTLLNICAGLVEPDGGAVTCDGRTVQIGDVGMVFQKPESQLFAETVLDDVAYGALNRGCSADDARQRAREALVQVGVDADELGGRSPFLLSGGQARRVAIAGVLVMKPRYLLLDEPAAGLDASGRAALKALLADLRSQGCGIVIVSHDIDEFLDQVDRVSLLDEGRAMWSGASSDIIAHPDLFGRAHLEPPDLLTFQQLLGGDAGTFSFEVERIAHWALGDDEGSGAACEAPDDVHVSDEGGRPHDAGEAAGAERRASDDGRGI